jgi:hypothetical protein
MAVYAVIKPGRDPRLEDLTIGDDPRGRFTDLAACARCGRALGVIYSHWEAVGGELRRHAYLRKPAGWRWRSDDGAWGEAPAAADRGKRDSQYGRFRNIELPCPVICPRCGERGRQVIEPAGRELGADRAKPREVAFHGDH